MDNETERISKKTIVSSFRVLFPTFAEKHKIHKKFSTRLAGLQAENNRLNLNNKKQIYDHSIEKEFNKRSAGLRMCLKVMAEFIRLIKLSVA